ncbi:hypothetical protein F5878DRAFT_667662 [Lentinula raphanica]|uniref:Uncharacterized protein n=1 Tax=Lentinula raphanica TaxID=153919 RepID=A0AA38NVD7_9AGAR|nr:hypothetical protein F5878DRAFT_667662 [Lentinula raphanica]
MYSWNSLKPLGSLFFFCWYWTVGFSSFRAGFNHLLLSVIYLCYYISFADAVAAMTPNADIVQLVVLICSDLQRYSSAVQFARSSTWKTEYNMFGRLPSPFGQCSQYMSNYISFAGGYLTNYDATSIVISAQPRRPTRSSRPRPTSLTLNDVPRMQRVITAN